MPEEEAPRRIVSDTGPLISLEKLSDGYRFIRLLYQRILIPEAVLRELAQGQFETEEDYLEHFGVRDLFDVRTVPPDEPLPEIMPLDEGEREAIRLARFENLPLLIEEESGRQVARKLGMPISGIVGQLLKAVHLGVLSPAEAEHKLRELRMAGRINARIFEAVQQAIQNEA